MMRLSRHKTSLISSKPNKFGRYKAIAALLVSLSTAANALDSTDLALCGEAKLSVLFWDVYESRLLTPGGEWQPGIRPLRLEIRYLRDIKAADLVEQTAKEWQAQGISTEQHNLWLDQLNAQWRDVSEGDVIALEIDEQGKSQFLFNGEPIGTIDHPQFGEDFAGIWLSQNTTRPELRKALIGEG